MIVMDYPHCFLNEYAILSVLSNFGYFSTGHFANIMQIFSEGFNHEIFTEWLYENSFECNAIIKYIAAHWNEESTHLQIQHLSLTHDSFYDWWISQ